MEPGAIVHSSNADAPSNSPQHPMRGRSLARRFRGSVRATLCVAIPESTGRARVSGRTLCRPLVVTLRSEATKGLRCKRAVKTRFRANRASCGELAAVDDARTALEELGGWAAFAGADSLEKSRRKCCFSRFYRRCETCTTPGAHFLSSGETAPSAPDVGFYFGSTE